MITLYHDIEQNYDSNADPEVCRNIVYEFLRLEKKYNIRATYNIVGKIFINQPDLIDRILNEGQEIAFHSYNHQTDWNSKYFSNEISLCRKVSLIPKGYRSPRSQINQEAVQTIWNEGFYWTAEGDRHSEPYFIYKGLVRLPIIADDWPLFEEKISADEWVNQFSKLIKNRSYTAFGLHDCVASFEPDKTLNAWEKVLQIAASSEKPKVTFSEAADLFRRSFIAMRLSSIAKEKLVNPNLNDIVKLLNKEIEGLNNPVIAFLSNSTEEQLGLKEVIINNCYLISSSLDDDNIKCFNINNKERIEAGFLFNSIDLLICLDSFELQYSPDILAQIINNYCKIGSKYIINFKAGNDNSNHDSLLENIKRNYTLAEIEKWSYNFGDYSITSNDDFINTSESDPHHEKGWSLIGKVQHRNNVQSNTRILPLSEYNFKFPNQNIEQYRIILESKKLLYLKPIKKAIKMLLNREY